MASCVSLRHGLASPLIIFLTLSPLVVQAFDLWEFDPDYGPAPPPESGPPIAANANRDPANLKWQIIGIVGGYVASLVIIGALLLTVGRRRRHAAQSSHGTLSMEMVKPNKLMVDNTRTVKQGGFHKFSLKSASSSVKTSPVVTVHSKFDESALEQDRATREREMERLYAAVMDSNAKAPKSISVKEDEISESSSGSSEHEHQAAQHAQAHHTHTRTLSSSSKRSFSQRNPPQRQHAAEPLPQHMPQDPLNSHSTAMAYTKHSPQIPLATSPTSPLSSHVRQASDDSSSTTSNRNSRNGYTMNRARHTRVIRNLTISAPIQNYQGDDDDERTPLSPRYPAHHSEHDIPTEPRPVTPILDNEDAEDEDILDAYGYEGLDQRQPLPRAAPQRAEAMPSGLPASPSSARMPHSPAMSSTSFTRYQQQNRPTGSTANTLPLRAMASNPSYAHSTHSSKQHAVAASPSPTKTTFLSPRRDDFRGGRRNDDDVVIPGFAPLHTGRSGPRTAGLGTPYSPYMPMSPVTPVTPGLMSREQRKQRQREEGRRVAYEEEDLVKDDSELWGEA